MYSPRTRPACPGPLSPSAASLDSGPANLPAKRSGLTPIAPSIPAIQRIYRTCIRILSPPVPALPARVVWPRSGALAHLLLVQARLGKDPLDLLQDRFVFRCCIQYACTVETFRQAQGCPFPRKAAKKEKHAPYRSSASVKPSLRSILPRLSLVPNAFPAQYSPTGAYRQPIP